MNCPNCKKNLSETGDYLSQVIDSRTSKNGKTVRRRRECLSCQSRWTTVEIAVEVQSGKSSSKLADALQRAALPEGVRLTSRKLKSYRNRPER